MKAPVSRLERYHTFIEHQFISELTLSKKYAIKFLSPEIEHALKEGSFSRIVFTGMGCSAIVSDLIKGFFVVEKIPVAIEVVNDYDFDYLLSSATVTDQKTLFIVSSYSGHSQEPLLAYQSLRSHTKNILLLTSGGKLMDIGIADRVSIVQWQLDNPDREYPLFHVPQYFAILLDLFHQFGMLAKNYQDKLSSTVLYLKESQQEFAFKGEELACAVRDADITLLATPKWHQILLKIVRMHLNEIAMAPAHINHFHEYCHSEVAILSYPQRKQSLILFKDVHDDKYTQKKMKNLQDLLEGQDSVAFCPVMIDQGDFFTQLFGTLLTMQYCTFHLGCYYNTPSRELISQAAGNPWYNQVTIEKENNHLTFKEL